MTLLILPEADKEMNAAAAWYDSRSPGLGEEFLEEVHRAYETFRSHSLGGTPLETYTGTHSIRRVLLQRFPYAIIARIRETETLVVAVAHTRRRPLYWAKRLN
jgi:toxin ParE1/3/4